MRERRVSMKGSVVIPFKNGSSQEFVWQASAPNPSARVGARERGGAVRRGRAALQTRPGGLAAGLFLTLAREHENAMGATCSGYGNSISPAPIRIFRAQQFLGTSFFDLEIQF